jgi:copper chaperone CopZ
MTCASCSVAVRIALKRLDGVRDAHVSVEDKRAVIDYEPAKVTPLQMVAEVNRLGYRASVAPKGS